MLYYVGVVAKMLRAAAETAAQEGDDNTPRGKNQHRFMSRKPTVTQLTQAIHE